MSHQITIEEALEQRGFYVLPSATMGGQSAPVYDDLTDLISFRGTETEIRRWLND